MTNESDPKGPKEVAAAPDAGEESSRELTDDELAQIAGGLSVETPHMPSP